MMVVFIYTYTSVYHHSSGEFDFSDLYDGCIYIYLHICLSRFTFITTQMVSLISDRGELNVVLETVCDKIYQ